MSTDSSAGTGQPAGASAGPAAASEATAASFDWLTVDPDEEVIWADTPHELSLVPAFIVGIPLSFVLIGLPILIGSYLSYKNTNYVVTSEALYKKTGILSRDVQRIEFDKVQNTSYRQGAIGAALGYGTVDISTAGGSGIEMRFNSVAEPQDVQTRINERIKHRRGGSAASADEEGGPRGRRKADVLDEILGELRAIRTVIEAGDGGSPERTGADGAAGSDRDGDGDSGGRPTGGDADRFDDGAHDRSTGRSGTDPTERTNGDPDER